MQLVYSILLLLAVVAILVQSQAVVVSSSKAVFTGVDNSDPEASGIELLFDDDNHATATASILGYFAKQQNFRPKEDGLYKNDQQFLDFRFSVRRFRSFTPLSIDNVSLKLTGGLNQLKEAIAAVYVPLSGTADAVASAFVEQIPESADPTLSGFWDLILITTHGGEENKITFELSEAEILISVNADGSLSIPSQEASIFQESFEVDPDYILEDALPFINNISVVNVTTFEDIFTTPKQKRNNPSLDAWLFGSDHGCENKFTHHRQRLYRLSQLRMDI